VASGSAECRRYGGLTLDGVREASGVDFADSDFHDHIFSEYEHYLKPNKTLISLLSNLPQKKALVSNNIKVCSQFVA